MGSQWTNKYAILRDLSFAQGRKVPVAIIDSVGVGQKPPAIRIEEDTPEEFFENYIDDSDVCTKPDLTLIKEMINMVRESDPVDDDDDLEKVVEISKLNPLSEEFVPNVTVVGTEHSQMKNECFDGQGTTKVDSAPKLNPVGVQRDAKPMKKRKERNVALKSLLEKEELSLNETQSRNNISTPTKQYDERPELTNDKKKFTVKLLKPNDFIIHATITDAVEKVNEWLQKPVEPHLENVKPISLSPKSMFKKKPTSLEGTCMFKVKSDTSSMSIKSSDSDMAPRKGDSVFVPSNHANEYYQKFVERQQVQEMAREDIWKRAERLMKEIDYKRLTEKEQKFAESLDVTQEHGAHLENDFDNKSGARASVPLNIPGE